MHIFQYFYNNFLVMYLSKGQDVNMLEIKDISEVYARLQQNTEYLTNVKRYVKGKKRINYQNSQHTIDPYSLFNVIIQSSYLLYSCYQSKEIAVFLSKDLYVVPQKDSSNYELVQDYIIKRLYDELAPEDQRYIEVNFNLVDPSSSYQAYANYMVERIKKYLDCLESIEKTSESKKSKDDRLRIQIKNLFDSIHKYISPRLQIMKPQIFIRCLQETNSFQLNSILLKTLNCSLYDNLCRKQKLGLIMKEVGKKQRFIAEKYDHTIKQDHFKYEVIQEQLQRFFQFLLKHHVIDIQISFNSNSSSMKESSKGSGSNQLGHTYKKEKGEERKTVWKVKVEEKKFAELNEETIKKIERGQKIINQEDNDGKKFSQFQIEYIPNRQLLVAKYVSEVEILLENMDALMFHCNNMMFQWNNASVEEIQIAPSSKNNQNTKTVQRVLAFKVVSHFNIKDDPLRNIILLIDLAMIYGKMAEPELKKTVVRLEDSGRFLTVANKINHLNNLFIKKIKRVYDQYAEKQEDSDY